jgi:hypothetical protein
MACALGSHLREVADRMDVPEVLTPIGFDDHG